VSSREPLEKAASYLSHLLLEALFTAVFIGEAPEQITAPYLLRYLGTVRMPLLEPPVV
jgi:hypothetical protein